MNSRRELLAKIKDEFSDLSEKEKGSVLEYAAFLSTSAVEREFVSEYSRLNATQRKDALTYIMKLGQERPPS